MDQEVVYMWLLVSLKRSQRIQKLREQLRKKFNDSEGFD
jgi:hypothetical protein